MRNMVPYVQFKNSHGGVKVTLIHGCFSRFLNCTVDTKSRKASQGKVFVKKFFLTHFMSTLLILPPENIKPEVFRG